MYNNQSSALLTNWQLGILLVGRLALNTAFRLLYPLLGFLAVGLQVDRITVSLLVTVQVAATMLSPLGGILSDARGERATIRAGLALFSAGAFVCALAQGFGFFLAGYVLVGLGTALFHPASQAYASARSPYSRRARVLGFLELSWALAALVGVTSLVWLVTLTSSWSPAFWLLFALGLAVLLATFVNLPQAPRRAPASDQPGAKTNWLAVLVRPAVLGALLVVFGTILGAELIFLVIEGWLAAAFGTTTQQVGTLFGALGVVELIGSLGSALLADRLGKRRAVLLGLVGAAVAQALLPFSAGNWPLFLVLFLLFDLCFEFAIVSTFPLTSGVFPAARGTVLAMGVAAGGLARVVGSLLAEPLRINVGFVANGLLAGAASLLAAAACFWLVREGESATESAGEWSQSSAD